MAEVATKKTINVVSSKKSSEVCSVQSNNGLIELDGITASNNQLITLCDNNEDLEDDLVLANNTRNELDTEDKSLQELIESELALRICSSAGTDDDDENDEDDDEDDATPYEEPDDEKPSTTQPEPVKRIVLDRREDPLDVNAEFIIAEKEHCVSVQDPLNADSFVVETERWHHVEDPLNVESFVVETERCHHVEDPTNVESFVAETERCQPVVDPANWSAEKLLAVMEYCAPVEDPYTYQNGHVSPPRTETAGDVAFDETSDPEPIGKDPQQDPREVEEIVPALDVDTDVTINELSSESNAREDTNPTPNARLDKFREEEALLAVPDDVDDLRVEAPVDDVQTSGCKNVDLLDTWPDQVSHSTDGQQAGQFSDNFDEALCPQNPLVAIATNATSDLDVDEPRENHDLFGTNAVADNIADDKDLLVQESTTQQDLIQIDSLLDSQSTNPVCETDPLEVERKEESRDQLDLEETNGPLVQVTSSPADSETSPEAASTREFLDMERRVLSEELSAPASHPEPVPSAEPTATSQESVVEFAESPRQDALESDQPQLQDQLVDCPSSDATNADEHPESHGRALVESTEVRVSDTNVTILSETRYVEACDAAEAALDSWVTVEEATKPAETPETPESPQSPQSPEPSATNGAAIDEELATKSTLCSTGNRAPLATPDAEASDVHDSTDSESREETITTSATVVTSAGQKAGTKTKKKKIEGVAGNDASSPNLTPRTKKTKKSKKSELEKENISVNGEAPEPSMRTVAARPNARPEMIDFSDEDDLSNVNVKSLTQNYVSEAKRAEQERSRRERIATGVSIKQLCRSFGDISNMADNEHAPFGKANHVMENEEKARSMGDLRVCERGYSRFFKDGPVFTGVSVKALRASYCSLASIASDGKEKDWAHDGTRCEKSSFNKFDALSKKTVLHVRSVDAAKVQQQLNAVGQNGDTNPSCRSCGKVVFQMEQTKAEGLVWHKNCFRCVQCAKQLNVDNYESHESTLYCKAHFKELFQPKPVEESDQPVRPRKPEMIIRENEPKELPPDVVRASDKPDLGLEELSSLNVKSRFQVFEKAGTEGSNEIERSPSQIAVKRSPSILSKLAKFQAKGMDIGVADESLNGIPYEESSESEEEEEPEETEETETEIVKSKRTTRERPISFSKMDDIKNRWESTSQQGRRETQREARKEEIAGIRSRLFMGKQGKMKEMYQQAVAGSERVTKINAAEEIQHATNARTIKERFERGEPIAAGSDDEADSGKPKPEKADEEVIAAGISRKSRSLFLELDATAAKTGRPVTPVNPTKTPGDAPRRARDAFMARQVSDDVVRSSDATEEVHVETSDISNKFKFFESYKEPEKARKQFRITPPRDGQVKMDSPDREIYRDPEVVRAEDRVNEVVHTDTARKMLSIFRQMEEKASKEELPDGPKPLKRFTPPLEDKYSRQGAGGESEDDEDEDGEESETEESAEERDPNYVRASDKVEDEFLKQAQNAARAKTLRAKFEHWEETDGKSSSGHSNHQQHPTHHNQQQQQQHVAEMEMGQSVGDQSSIESASSLRARFESLGSQPAEAPRTPKVKVNRFVEIQTNCMDVCESCQKKVYPLEKVETNNKIFHKQCFRCLQCNCILRMDTFTLNNGKLYCIPHFKQLFITRGNYDEGFGVDPHKNKWATSGSNNPSTPPPIAVSNGDV